MKSSVRVTASLTLALLPLAACGGDPDLRAATATLRRFHRALVDRDLAALRDSLARGSRHFARLLPAPGNRSSRPLEILRARRENSRFYLEVRDENAGAAVREGTYVVVKESGDWRVDLVETAGHNAREHALPGSPTRLVPASLNRRQLEATRRALQNRAATGRKPAGLGSG